MYGKRCSTASFMMCPSATLCISIVLFFSGDQFSSGPISSERFRKTFHLINTNNCWTISDSTALTDFHLPHRKFYQKPTSEFTTHAIGWISHRYQIGRLSRCTLIYSTQVAIVANRSTHFIPPSAAVLIHSEMKDRG